MGCPTKVKLEDSIIFSICCHDPDTGVLTDADDFPVFRVYEDETETPISGGSMEKLDDANTTGFYIGELTCSGRNGYNVGKSYNIYIEATVDGSTGGMCYGFTVKPSYWQNADVEGINIIDGKYYYITGRIRNR